MSSAWEAVRQRPRPKSPKPPPFDALRQRLGVPEDAPPREPEPVEGPIIDVPQRFHGADESCSGSFRLIDQDGPTWTACCDRCRAEVCVPAAGQDPEIRQKARLAAAHLPDIFAGKLFTRHPGVEPTLEALRQWLSGCTAQQKPDKRRASLLPAPALYGLPGRGKSHLLTVICERVIAECDLPVAFYTARGLLRDLQRFDDDVVRGHAWERATTVDVLALDDLGAEQTTPWRLDQLAELVDERYQHERPIVIATNYPPSQWAQRLDARTVSRLGQMTFTLELQGVDRRQTHMQEEAA